MTIEIASEIWSEICFLLKEISDKTWSEGRFENNVVRALEALGWRQSRGEIQEKPRTQLGNANSIIPDWVITNGAEGKKLIVVEVKRPGIDLNKDNHIGQLRSYMRIEKVEFGLLIGSELQIFWDGKTNPSQDILLLESLCFSENLPEGKQFAKLFGKENFLNEEYSGYVNNKVCTFNEKALIQSATQKIHSSEMKNNIVEYIRSEFQEIGDETFAEIMGNINLNIANKSIVIPSDIQSPKHRLPKSDPFPVPLVGVGSTININPNVSIPTLPFENRSVETLRQIYAVLYFMISGNDYPTAVNESVKIFPKVQDYQTIADKCTRKCGCGCVTFKLWYASGDMLANLTRIFDLSKNDYNIFENLFKKTITR